MAITEYHNIWRIVREDCRIWIPDKETPDWVQQGGVYLWPLHLETQSKLGDDRFFQAWVLSPSIGDAPVSQESDLAAMVFSHKIGASTSSNTKTWSFSIPEAHRVNGWLPSKGGSVLVRVRGERVELWDGAAYEAHAMALAKELLDEQAAE